MASRFLVTFCVLIGVGLAAQTPTSTPSLHLRITAERLQQTPLISPVGEDEAAAGTWSASQDAVTLVVQQYESNDPGSDSKFGPSILKIEDGALILPRYDRRLRFRRMK